MQHLASMWRSHKPASLAVLTCSLLALAAIPTQAQSDKPPAPVTRYVYDITADGLVHVTIFPPVNGEYKLPATAENIKAEGLKVETDLQWTKFTNFAKITLEPGAKDAKLTYDWPDGALPWPVKNSDWLPQSDRRWYADVFSVNMPAEATLIAPKGIKWMEFRDWDGKYKHVESQTADGRHQSVFTITEKPPFRFCWIGGVLDMPWADKYAIHGQGPTRLYYPKLFQKYPEYMQKVKALFDASVEHYASYDTKLKFHPPYDSAFYAVSWLQGWGGAYTTGAGCYYNYRNLAAFEWPPVIDGGNLMGAYHELAHLFQPPGYPEYVGGHTWTAYLNIYYDYHKFPTVAEVEAKIAAGKKEDERYTKGWKVYRQLRENNLVPPLYTKWDDEIPAAAQYLKDIKHDEDLSHVREAAWVWILLSLEREFGQDYWGKFAKNFLASGVMYEHTDRPLEMKIVAAQMSAAAGKDLSAKLSEMSENDLWIDLKEDSKNLVDPAAWKLEAHKPAAAKFERDKQVKLSTESLRLEVSDLNDARIVQTIKVKPKTWYVIAADVKTKDVPVGIAGVTVGAFQDQDSYRLHGDHDWRQRGKVFFADDASEITIFLRIGRNEHLSKGTAWFDNVRVYPLESKEAWKLFGSKEFPIPEQQPKPKTADAAQK